MEEYEMISRQEMSHFLSDLAGFLKKCVFFLWSSVVRQPLLFVFLFVAVMGIGYGLHVRKPAYYESKMACTYNHLHKKTFGEMVQRIGALISEGSYQQVAKELNIPVETASSITGISAANMTGSPLHEDITMERTPMYFTLQARNREIFPIVQEALLRYLNGTEYQNKRIALERVKIEQRALMLKNSLKQLDTVIYSYSTFLNHAKAASDSAAGFSNIAALFSYKEQLEEKMLETQKSLSLLETVEMIYGFAPSDKPVSPGYSYWIKLLMVALGAAVAGTALRQLWKNG